MSYNFDQQKASRIHDKNTQKPPIADNCRDVSPAIIGPRKCLYIRVLGRIVDEM